MLHRTSKIILGLTLLSAATLPAQHEPGDILIGTASPASIQRIQPGTPVTARVAYQSPASGALSYGLTMDVDNRAVLMSVTNDPFQPQASAGIWRIDPKSGTVLGVVGQGTALFESPRQIVVDQNGDYVVASRGATSATTFEYRLLHINRLTGAVTTIIRETALNQPAEWRGGLTSDVDTGDFILQDRDAAAPVATRFPLLRVTPSGGISTIAYLPIQPRYGVTQDLRTGDFYAGYVVDLPLPDGGLFRITKAGAVTTPVIGDPGGSRHAFTAVLADRATAASRRIVSTYVGHVYYTDIATAAVTSIAAPPLLLRSPRATEIEGSRHVQTLLTGTRRWSIDLSYPNHAGKAYVMAASASGVRPGTPLADGRRILLNIDTLTLITLQNLFPLFNSGPGLLDANGRASGSINLKPIPVVGQPIWIQVVVIDPSAPLGLAVVEDPYPLRV